MSEIAYADFERIIESGALDLLADLPWQIGDDGVPFIEIPL